MLAIVPPWRMPRRFSEKTGLARPIAEIEGGRGLGEPYSVLFLDHKLEVDDSWSGSCDFELKHCCILAYTIAIERKHRPLEREQKSFL